jgi:hypothetical protein
MNLDAVGTHDEEVAALAALVARAADDDPLEALAALAAARRELEALEALAVRRARVRSASWASIAHAMGVSRQAAHQRFRLSRWGDR